MPGYPWPNLVSLFYAQVNKLGDRPFVWRKENGVYTPYSWNDAEARVTPLARGLQRLGVKPGDRIMLVSENRPLWPMADVGVMAAGTVTVPAYTTNTAADHLHVLNDSGSVGAIVSTRKLAEKLLPAVDQAEACRFVIVLEEIGGLQTAADLIHLPELLERGRDGSETIVERAAAISRDDIACIIYTSGTGGAPKGVMLPHRAILHNLMGAIDALEDLGVTEGEPEVFLSFLPLSHSYEHTAGLYFPMAIGGEVYYAEGVETLAANMAECRPTIMTAVPRLYESMRQKIERGLAKSGGLRERLFRRALDIGARRYHDPASLGVGDRLLDPLLDKLVRAKVKDRFGGRLKALVSGGAPLNPDVGVYFTALGLTLLQGYGQTESAPLISVNRKSSLKLHSVGPKVINTELKIASDGEICVKGDLVMRGYWNNEEATNAAIIDGWLHTGDVGHVDEDGHIVITDRKKDIIVNSGGDNIAPQRVEGFLALEQEIGQVMVYGDKRPHLVALVVPDADWLTEWKRENGKKGGLADLAGDKDLADAIKPALERANAKLNNIEKVRRFVIAGDAFTVDNEQMTPTMKVRRHIVKKIYGDALEGLYGG